MVRAIIVLMAVAMCAAAFGEEKAGEAKEHKKEAAKVGDELPDLSAKDETGKEIKLSDYKGKTGLILFFYPKADTPGCTKESCNFRDGLPKLTEKGYQPMGISRDTPEDQMKFKEKFKLTYPLLSDPDAKLAAAFGFAPGQRATAVIGKDGKIEKIYAKVVPAQHADEILKELEGK